MYILEVLLALFIATAPAIVGAGLSKYKITGFPPTQCRSYGEFRFYSLILPVMATVCICVIFMLLALYKVHVVSTCRLLSIPQALVHRGGGWGVVGSQEVAGHKT